MHHTVEVERLTYSYPDGHQVPSEVSLSIAPGEKVALVGPNGAGKSTLMLHLDDSRLTPQREMVLSALHELDGRATVEQLYRRVQVFSTSVDISTVYRTLDLLHELGLIASIDAPDSSASPHGQRTYELHGVPGRHAHLACRACGTIVGADLEPVQALASEREAEYGFLMDPDRLSFLGLCRKCRQGVSLDSDQPGVPHLG